MKKTPRRAAALISGALAAVLLVPGVAHAEDTAPQRPRIERACLRIPNLELRTQQLIRRLEADASVSGSLAWLEAQANRAADAGRDQLATVLRNRLAVRRQTLEVLKVRDARLDELAARCRAWGVQL
jgi:hypothetical protein